jgi:hypothetical protein
VAIGEPAAPDRPKVQPAATWADWNLQALKRAFEVGASFFGQSNDQSGAQESKRLYSVRGTMVRDAYSAGGQPQQADGGAAAQPLELHSSTANLTQELSLLLAASIAQGQAAKRAASPVSAGSELANLQALVSASQSQRAALQPTFRDGLSSLSYTRPAQPPMPPLPTPAPAPAIVPPPVPVTVGGGLLVAEVHDEEPMPIPSTWRQPMPNDDERWYRQQLGAAGLGLVAGLIVVVPAVLWLSGWLGGPQSKPVARQQPAPEAVKVAELPTVKVRINTASAEARIPDAAPEPPETVAPTPVAPAPTSSRTRTIAEPAAPVMQPPPAMAAVAPRPEPPPTAPVRSRADELLTQAKRLIESKDIVGARELLQASETASSGALIFMLAETYDPSMLAIWQVKPDGISANPERARSLYTRARDLGESRAQQRLEWLK